MQVDTPHAFIRVARCLLIGSALSLGAATSVAADLGGYWALDIKRSELRVDVTQLTRQAQERVRSFNPVKHDPATVCMPYGMPRVMTALGAFPMEIIQTDTQITMLFDAHDEVRRVMLKKELHEQEELAPLWLGYATGRWSGKTLIVETRGITDQSLATENGIPHSKELRVTERIRRIDDDTLLNEMTLTDAQAFSQPVVRKVYYKRVPELQQREFHCAADMWLDHVMDRAKELTRELAEKKP